MVGAGDLNTFNQVDEYQALVALKAHESSEGDYSIFDNYDVYRTIDRANVVDRVVN